VAASTSSDTLLHVQDAHVELAGCDRGVAAGDVLGEIVGVETIDDVCSKLLIAKGLADRREGIGDSFDLVEEGRGREAPLLHLGELPTKLSGARMSLRVEGMGEGHPGVHGGGGEEDEPVKNIGSQIFVVFRVY
jgi:hypothetical protein